MSGSGRGGRVEVDKLPPPHLARESVELVVQAPPELEAPVEFRLGFVGDDHLIHLVG